MSQFINFPITALFLISNLSPLLQQLSPLKNDPPDLAVIDFRWKEIREENWPTNTSSMKMVQLGFSISILNGPNSACSGGRDVGFLSVPQLPFAGLARRGPADQSQSSILDYESHFG